VVAWIADVVAIQGMREAVVDGNSHDSLAILGFTLVLSAAKSREGRGGRG
jgi:hypothetical protein